MKEKQLKKAFALKVFQNCSSILKYGIAWRQEHKDFWSKYLELLKGISFLKNQKLIK